MRPDARTITPKDPQQRETIIGGLASFRDTKIVQQSLKLLLDPDLDIRETFFRLIFGPLGDRQTEKIPFEFLKANYDPLVKRLPSTAGIDFRAFLPFVGGSFCDEPSRLEFAGFFESRAKDYIGGPRNYSQALESIRLCEARRAAQAGDVANFFTRQENQP